MGDNHVEVTEGSGKKVDTRTTPGGDHRQVIVLGDPNSDTVVNASDLTSLLTSVRDYLDTVETKLQSLIDNTDGLEGFTDGVEGLLTSVRDYVDQLEGYVDGLEAGIGAQADAEAATGNGSLIALIKNLRTRLGNIETYLDGVEGSLSNVDTDTTAISDRIGEIADSPTTNTLQDRLKGIKAVLDTISGNTDQLEGYTDQLEGYVDTLESLVDGLEGFVDGLESTLSTISTKLTDRTQKTQLTDGTDDLPIGPVSTATGIATASGDTIMLSVATGFKVKLYHFSFVPTTASLVDVDVILKIGTTEKMGWRSNKNGGGFAHSPKNGQAWFEGADGDDVVINLSAADSIRYNITYDLVAV